MTVRVKPKRDRKAPFRFKLTGSVKPSSGAKSQCRGSQVRFTVKRKGSRKVRLRTTARVSSTCTFAKRIRFRNATQLGKPRGKLVISTRFLGNSRLKPRSGKKLVVRYG